MIWKPVVGWEGVRSRSGPKVWGEQVDDRSDLET